MTKTSYLCVPMIGRANELVMACVVLLTLVFATASIHANGATDEQTIVIFDDASISWLADGPKTQQLDGYVSHARGQVIETTVQLPDEPINQRDAKQITLIATAEPVRVTDGSRERFADPWPRLFHVAVVTDKPVNPPIEKSQLQASNKNDNASDEDEIELEPSIELARAVTGFGGRTEFEFDVTSLAPLLAGETTFRVRLRTWMTPGWDVSLRLKYEDGGIGYRRPKLAEALFSEVRLTSENNRVAQRIDIPEGLTRPRIQITSTGHGGMQEFKTATHLLRVDGRTVARFRPWREDGGEAHGINPASRRINLDGRELWSSDIDRSGWLPGTAVDVLTIPLPELTPGSHTVELVVLDIVAPPPAAATDSNNGGDETADGDNSVTVTNTGIGDVGGYWICTAIVVADEPWPSRRGE